MSLLFYNRKFSVSVELTARVFLILRFETLNIILSAYRLPYKSKLFWPPLANVRFIIYWSKQLRGKKFFGGMGVDNKLPKVNASILTKVLPYVALKWTVPNKKPSNQMQWNATAKAEMIKQNSWTRKLIGHWIMMKGIIRKGSQQVVMAITFQRVN